MLSSTGSLWQSFSNAGWTSLRVCGKVTQYYALYNLWDCAISNLLALDNLRHGTSFPNYVRIQFTGLDPTKGGTGGETIFYQIQIAQKRKQEAAANEIPHELSLEQDRRKQKWAADCRGHVFVLKDTEYKTIEYGGKCFNITVDESSKDRYDHRISYDERGEAFRWQINKAEDDALLSTKVKNYFRKAFAMLNYSFKGNRSMHPAPVNQKLETPFFLFLTLLTPVVKFHFDNYHLQQLKEQYPHPGGMRDDPSADDPEARDTSYQSNIRISPWHLGISGSLIQGVNRNLPKRIQRTPLKPLLGMVQLIFAVGLTARLFAPEALSQWSRAAYLFNAAQTSRVAWLAIHSVHVSTL